MEPAHFFVSFLIFPSEEFFPQRLVNTAFYSPTVGATCFLLSKSFSSFTFLSISEVIKRRITTNKHYYFYNIEKNSKKYAKNIYKDTNVCYADAVTDRPFC